MAGQGLCIGVDALLLPLQPQTQLQEVVRPGFCTYRWSTEAKPETGVAGGLMWGL